MTATVAAPTSNQFGVLLAIFLVLAFTTCVVLWVHERRWDRHDDELAVHHEQLATLAGRLQSIADFLDVDVHDARDDSPGAESRTREAESKVAFELPPDETPTEEFPVAPATVPDGIPLAVQSALLGKSAEWVEVEIAALRARNAERMARAAVAKEAS
jgi:uncharacterized membrane protein